MTERRVDCDLDAAIHHLLALTGMLPVEKLVSAGHFEYQ
jgi:hypothetical protein